MTNFILQPMIIWTALLGVFVLTILATCFYYSETADALRLLSILATGFIIVVGLPIALFLSESWSVLIAVLMPHIIAAIVLFIYLFSVVFDKTMECLISLKIDDDPWK